MALRSAVHGLISTLASLGSTVTGIAWAGFLTIVVAGPWLQPGYLFGTDWPGPRRFDFPAELSSAAPMEAILAVSSRLMGGELTGKLVVIVLLFGAGALAFKAVPKGGFVPRATAATIYVANPFVYGRLHYGQLFVLCAYALFPWVATRIRLLFDAPGLRASFLAGVSMASLGVFSIHLVLIGSLLAGCLFAAQIAFAGSRAEFLKLTTPWLLVAAAVALAASAYWLAPLWVGLGPEATVIARTGAGDLRAYAAVADRTFGLVPNLLGLYGFWAENSGRFSSMKYFVPPWPLFLAGLLAVMGFGIASALKDRKQAVRAWSVGLLVAAGIGLILEMGMSHPATAPLVQWLDAHFAFYRGMRDAGKWAALLAFAYSQLAALGAIAILTWIDRAIKRPVAVQWTGAVAAALLLAAPLYYGNGLLFGAHGEIQPSPYPAGWYSADRMLAADPHPDLTLFLPWHQYMSYGFIRNQNRVVATPGPSFFSVPLLVSTNPEVPGTEPPMDADQQAISGLVASGGQGTWAATLAAQNVKYILLARELDWASFEYLNAQEGLSEVGDWGSIVLYRNLLLT